MRRQGNEGGMCLLSQEMQKSVLFILIKFWKYIMNKRNCTMLKLQGFKVRCENF